MIHSDRVILWGQSCVGKTTFAKTMKHHRYYCFDALYPWHDIEGLGLSSKNALKFVSQSCVGSKWVLDGWNLCDPKGELFPENVTVYVLWADLEIIAARYPYIIQSENLKQMHLKWYKTLDFPHIRYFWVENAPIELERQVFLEKCEKSLRL